MHEWKNIYSVSRYLNGFCLEFKPYKKVLKTQRWRSLTSVNFRRVRKNPRARPRGNRWEFSLLRLRYNRASSAEQQRQCLAICSRSRSEKRTAANCTGKRRHPVCVCQMLGQAVRTASERVSGSVRWTSVVKVSIIALALPYFSYGKLYRVVS